MKKEKQITEKIYRMYASDTGILFGLPPEVKQIVESIVKVALEIYESELKSRAEQIKQKKEG